MALTPVFVLVYLIGCFYAGRLARVFLGLLVKYRADADRRAQRLHHEYSVSLAEWLQETSQHETGR